MLQPGHHFFAYLSRMKLIDRWSLMRCVRRENVQEHSLQVAMVAHALAVIKNKYFGGKLSPDTVALYAIFHDATEVLTGDLPTPVKYYNAEIRGAYKEIEDHSTEQLLKLLPQELRDEYRPFLKGTPSDDETLAIIKAADNLCAYIKCLEELAAGNNEFSRARKTIEEKINKLSSRKEVAYFLEHFIPGFSLTLDEISAGLD